MRSALAYVALAATFVQQVVTVPTVGLPARGNRNVHWVDTWATMPQLTEVGNLPPAPYVCVSIYSGGAF